MKTLLAIFVFLLPACAEPGNYSAHLTKAQVQSIVEKAREKILASSVLKGEQEAHFIRTTEPTLSYYFLTKPYADYAIRWAVGNEETVSVHGRGNILELEGATVERINK